MGKKINQLDPGSNSDATDNTRLMPSADPITGIAIYVSVEQMKLAFHTKTIYYVTDGTEGSTLTISQLANKFIVAIDREGGPLYEVESSPESAEFTWDQNDIVLGAIVAAAGERFRIQYRDF